MAFVEYLQVPPLNFDSQLFPLRRPKYEISPGLKPLNDLSELFWIDQQYDLYIDEKSKCRQENPSKYYCYSEDFEQYERFFSAAIEEVLAQKGIVLPKRGSEYHSQFDYLASHLQEDMAVVKREEKEDRLLAVHLSFPNHWDPREKINKHFNDVHAPVADFEALARRSKQMVDLMIYKGPYVRFAWGLSTDTRLNHHPEVPRNTDPNLWQGRSFDPKDPKLFMRIERQCTLGMPEIDCALFTIRTYFLDVHDIKKDSKSKEILRGALQSMSEATRKYKGLTDYASILSWIS